MNKQATAGPGNDKMQDEFEAAIAIESGEPITAIFLSRRGDTYATSALRFAWWAWQASRAAIEVELPARKKPTSWESYENHHNNMLGVFEKALEAAGLKVKP